MFRKSRCACVRHPSLPVDFARKTTSIQCHVFSHTVLKVSVNVEKSVLSKFYEHETNPVFEMFACDQNNTVECHQEIVISRLIRNLIALCIYAQAGTT